MNRFFEGLPRPIQRAACPFLIFVVNAVIVWRLFFTSYLVHFWSIEGSFIGLAEYIRRNWPAYDWLPLWYAGFPFTMSYQPLLHYVVAAFGAMSGVSTAAAYHFVAAMVYCLSGVAFYWLARTLGAERITALAGALAYSLFSPSALLFRDISHDIGSILHARRLQTLVVYGEGPNNTGLMLGMLALGLFHRALARRTTASAAQCAAAIALVAATSWPASIALGIALLAYLAALETSELVALKGRILQVAGIAACFALPFALPSTVLGTFGNANHMGGSPTEGTARQVGIVIVLVLTAIVRWLMFRRPVPFAIRYAAINSTLLLGIVVAGSRDIRLVPQPMRFHLAMETALILLAMFVLRSALEKRPGPAKAVAAILAVVFAVQIYNYQKFARSTIVPAEVEKSVEYQESMWLHAQKPSARVVVPGSVSFWLNTFTPTPQLTGCCEQSQINPVDPIVAYIIGAGHETESQSADYSLLWLKAFAIDYFGTGGPASREAYKAFQFPYRFKDRLPLVWSNGDDYIYRVPERVPGLARVVRIGDLVANMPANGIDVPELRKFVSALDDPTLPEASWQWRGPNAGILRGNWRQGDAVSLAINYHPGWSASVNGKPVTVRPDGLGLIELEPGCVGCTVDLAWSPGKEPLVAWGAAILALGWCGIRIRAESRSQNPA